MFMQKAVQQVLAVITANGVRERPFYSVDLGLFYIRPFTSSDQTKIQHNKKDNKQQGFILYVINKF